MRQHGAEPPPDLPVPSRLPQASLVEWAATVGLSLRPLAPGGTVAEGALALFLDIDGTLTAITLDPAEADFPPRLLHCLQALEQQLEGALALISGRPLTGIDHLTAPHRFAAAGQHGLERREGKSSARLLAAPPPQGLAAIVTALDRVIDRHPGLWLEHKSHALALHYGTAPQHADAARAALARFRTLSSPPLVLVEGKGAVELRSPAADKGQALRAFMAVPPFLGRHPVYLGDDISDEDAFAAVNALGGTSLLVGRRPSRAAWRLDSVQEVRQWLGATEEAPLPKGN